MSNKVTRDDIYMQNMKGVGRCVMSAVSAIQKYPVKTQMVAFACLFALIYDADLVEDISMTELMTLADRLIRSRDVKGINGAEAYAQNYLGGH